MSRKRALPRPRPVVMLVVREFDRGFETGSNDRKENTEFGDRGRPMDRRPTGRERSIPLAKDGKKSKNLAGEHKSARGVPSALESREACRAWRRVSRGARADASGGNRSQSSSARDPRARAACGPPRFSPSTRPPEGFPGRSSNLTLVARLSSVVRLALTGLVPDPSAARRWRRARPKPRASTPSSRCPGANSSIKRASPSASRRFARRSRPRPRPRLLSPRLGTMGPFPRESTATGRATTRRGRTGGRRR